MKAHPNESKSTAIEFIGTPFSRRKPVLPTLILPDSSVLNPLSVGATFATVLTSVGRQGGAADLVQHAAEDINRERTDLLRPLRVKPRAVAQSNRSTEFARLCWPNAVNPC